MVRSPRQLGLARGALTLSAHLFSFYIARLQLASGKANVPVLINKEALMCGYGKYFIMPKNNPGCYNDCSTVKLKRFHGKDLSELQKLCNFCRIVGLAVLIRHRANFS